MSLVLEPKIWTSRAVTRRIEPGNLAFCMECDEAVKFRARMALYQVICNVYTNGVWDRVEHFHEECYGTAAAPFGDPVT